LFNVQAPVVWGVLVNTRRGAVPGRCRVAGAGGAAGAVRAWQAGEWASSLRSRVRSGLRRQGLGPAADAYSPGVILDELLGGEACCFSELPFPRFNHILSSLLLFQFRRGACDIDRPALVTHS